MTCETPRKTKACERTDTYALESFVAAVTYAYTHPNRDIAAESKSMYGSSFRIMDIRPND